MRHPQTQQQNKTNMATAYTKWYQFSTGPFSLKSLGPKDTEEYNATGANETEDAIGGCIAWDHIPSLHEQICKVIEAATGVVRGVDEKLTAAAKAKKADAKDVPEKAVPYMKRVVATLVKTNDKGETVADDAAIKALNDTVQEEVAAKNPIDVSPGTRRTGAGKEATTIAEDVLGRSPADIDIAVEKISARAPEFVLERDSVGTPVLESLAMMIRVAIDSAKKY